jgi:membrane-associated phospholipid phosphatase
MNKITLFFMLNIISIGIIFLSFYCIDKPLSIFIHHHFDEKKPFFLNFTTAFDNYSGYIIWIYILSLIVGTMLVFKAKYKKIGFALLTLLVANIGGTVLTSVIKSKVKRARPEIHLIQKQNNIELHQELTLNYSFPSSHTSFYLSLFLPFAILFRKYACLILIIPGIIIVGRIVQNEHFLSDVLGSVLIVSNLCFIAKEVFALIDFKLLVPILYRNSLKVKLE